MVKLLWTYSTILQIVLLKQGKPLGGKQKMTALRAQGKTVKNNSH